MKKFGKLLVFVSWLLVLMFKAEIIDAKEVYVPVIDGKWWQVAKNPDLGEFTSEGQQPVDFAVWQAADGTWQLWSCIRNNKSPGKKRLFYGWESKKLTDKKWKPKGIMMRADVTAGETEGGLQAPYVMKENGIYYMFYGDWENICLAKSTDGKKFERVLNENGKSALFTGPMTNTRDAMVIKINNKYYCYYSGHLDKKSPEKIKAAVFCRTSDDLKTWSEPVTVSCGGKAAGLTDWFGGDAECPFVVNINDKYVLFKNQVYGKNNLNTQYCSEDPLNFGIDNDDFMVSQLAIAAAEIIKFNDQYYIAALLPTLDGIRIAKLRFELRKE